MVERERYVPELKGLFAFLPSFTGYSVSSCDVRGLVTGPGGLRTEWQAGAVLSESSVLLGGGRVISDTHECFWDNKAARMQRVTEQGWLLNGLGGPSAEPISELRPQWQEGAGHLNRFGKGVPGRGKVKGTVPEAGTKLVCAGDRRNASMAGV